VSHPFQVNHYSTDNTHDVARVRTEVVVPCSRGHPRFVVLQQIGVDKHTQLSCVTEGTHAALGPENPFPHIQIGSIQIETPRSQCMFPMSPLPASAQVYTYPRQYRRNLR